MAHLLLIIRHLIVRPELHQFLITLRSVLFVGGFYFARFIFLRQRWLHCCISRLNFLFLGGGGGGSFHWKHLCVAGSSLTNTLLFFPCLNSMLFRVNELFALITHSIRGLHALFTIYFLLNQFYIRASSCFPASNIRTSRFTCLFSTFSVLE